MNIFLFGIFEKYRRFVEKDKIPNSIISTIQAAGLKVEMARLADFRTLKQTELALLIGSDDFFQFAIEYSIPKATLAYVPLRASPLSKHFYKTSNTRLGKEQFENQIEV